MKTEYLTVKFTMTTRRLLPCELASSREPPLTKGRLQSRRTEKVFDLGGELIGAGRIEIKGGVPSNFGEAGSGGGNNGSATSHGFKDWQTKALHGGRHDEKIGSSVQTWKQGLRDVRNNDYAIANAEAQGFIDQGMFPARIVANNEERMAHSVGEAELRESAQESGNVFVGLEIADVEKERWTNPDNTGSIEKLGGGIAGGEFFADAAWDDGDLRLRDSEDLDNFVF